jgi:putative transferase (TIGR04331 family)
VHGLADKIRRELIVRLYPHDYGWNQFDRWTNEFPELLLDTGSIPINKQIHKSRIFISTYNATTFLETFVMNVPTVMYWNEKHWELRDSAIPFYKELKRVGVFHSTPASAAAHVNKIWEDVDGWWYSDDVQMAVNNFSKRFCDTSGDVSTKLAWVIKNVINESAIELSTKS